MDSGIFHAWEWWDEGLVGGIKKYNFYIYKGLSELWEDFFSFGMGGAVESRH